MVETPKEFAELFSRLEGVTGREPSWKAKCPCHDDKKPSLSIRLNPKGDLWLKCHGCGSPPAAVMKKLGLRMQHLYRPDHRSGHHDEPGEVMSSGRKVGAVYRYCGPDGKTRYETVRYDPKDFVQRRPNPDFRPGEMVGRDNPDYLYNLQGVDLVPYRLPDLLAAWQQNPNKTVVIAEGEKDCDLLWSKGLLATCNPMGAGKWKDQYSEFLRGRNVVVIPDEDPVDSNLGYSPGVRHAEQVCASLSGKAALVKLVRLDNVPLKGDISDWWPLGGKSDDDRKKDLKVLVDKTPAWKGDAKPSANGQAPLPGADRPDPDKLNNELVDKEAAMVRAYLCQSGEMFTYVKTEMVKAGCELKREAITHESAALARKLAADFGLMMEEKIKKRAEETKAAPVTPVAIPVTVPIQEPASDKIPAAQISMDKAERLLLYRKSVIETEQAMTAAGVQFRSFSEWYGSVRMMMAEIDGAITCGRGGPQLDKERLGQAVLLLGAYAEMGAVQLEIGLNVLPGK